MLAILSRSEYDNVAEELQLNDMGLTCSNP